MWDTYRKVPENRHRDSCHINRRDPCQICHIQSQLIPVAESQDDMAANLFVGADVSVLVPASRSIGSSDTIKVASDWIPEARFHDTDLVVFNHLFKKLVRIDDRSCRSSFCRALCRQLCHRPDGSIGVGFPIVLQPRDWSGRGRFGVVGCSCLSLTVPGLATCA